MKQQNWFILFWSFYSEFFQFILSLQPVTWDLFIQLATQPYLAENKITEKKVSKSRQIERKDEKRSEIKSEVWHWKPKLPWINWVSFLWVLEVSIELKVFFFKVSDWENKYFWVFGVMLIFKNFYVISFLNFELKFQFMFPSRCF